MKKTGTQYNLKWSLLSVRADDAVDTCLAQKGLAEHFYRAHGNVSVLRTVAGLFIRKCFAEEMWIYHVLSNQ